MNTRRFSLLISFLVGLLASGQTSSVAAGTYSEPAGNHLRFCADGKFVCAATRQEMEAEGIKGAGPNSGILTGPTFVWVDSETVPWHGLPAEASLMVDFETDYIRIWQRHPPGAKKKGMQVRTLLLDKTHPAPAAAPETDAKRLNFQL